MHVTPIARTSGGGDIDLVYGENSLLRHAKNKKTLFEPKPISKTCQCRKFEVLALIILSATYHDYNSRRHQHFARFLGSIPMNKLVRNIPAMHPSTCTVKSIGIAAIEPKSANTI